MRPSLSTRIWSAPTTVESLQGKAGCYSGLGEVTQHKELQSQGCHSWAGGQVCKSLGTSQISPFPCPYLCATTTVVRWVQTLAREAWMFLSVSVSSADVACGRGRVCGRDIGSCWGRGCCRAEQGWAGGCYCYLI